jgi:hypothetical protein
VAYTTNATSILIVGAFLTKYFARTVLSVAAIITSLMRSLKILWVGLKILHHPQPFLMP